MSDDEGKGSGGGYRIELAKSKQAACKGPKPCKGTKIQKGELRMGVVVDFRGHSTFQWRHWGCVTPAVLSNMKKKHPEVEDLDGFEDLDDGFQAKIETAWQEGHVADEDIPDSARKGPDDTNEDEDDDKKKKTASKRKAAPRKKKGDAAEVGSDEEKTVAKRPVKKTKGKATDDTAEEETEKSTQKVRAPPKKKAKKSEDTDNDDDIEPKKAVTKRKAAKKAADESGDEPAVIDAPKKRRAPKKRGAAADNDESGRDKGKKKVPAGKVSAKSAKKIEANASDLEEIELPELADESDADEPKPTVKQADAKAQANAGTEKAGRRVADEDYGDGDAASGTDDNVASGSKRKRSDLKSEADNAVKLKGKSGSKAKVTKPASIASEGGRGSKRSGRGVPKAVAEEADDMEED